MNTPEASPHHWRKSTHSGGVENDCVEITSMDDHIAIRDSKTATAGHLTLTRRDFATLLAHLESKP
ncbi:DUF397 domain-containing protein [Actinomadura graeca]|uniref:DUF397 domain-containing protein n=1 Tax=Actinomadura graeca TaxID=2750812 RepID=A0ABX8QPP5_9ACTN|nr:DUF397 domain-containing protein [Actinomadura graeca]QXJ20765.1 DUF397 domain-containing protein [Actinomadura graeca]